MTITADDYISAVVDRLPRATTLRSHIAAELRGHIADRIERGQSIDEVVRQLGDPNVLAESYLAAVPMVPASFWRRVAAKGLDSIMIAAAVGAIALTVWLTRLLPVELLPILVGVSCIAIASGIPLYTVIAEYSAGYTAGKRLMGLRVVRESGARISLGQSIIRQLPVFGQIYLIDVLFALFTEKHQRAFELASKTRVIAVE